MADSGSARLSRQTSVFLLFIAMIGAASMTYFHLGLFIPQVLESRTISGMGSGFSFGDDFYPIWRVARVWRERRFDLYGKAMTREIQVGLFGRPLSSGNPNDPPADYRQFAYPAFTELLLWPTALIDFPALRIVLAIVLPMLTIASLWLWVTALRWTPTLLGFLTLALLVLSSYELLEAFFAEQPGLLVNFCLAASALALRRNLLLLSGILMALTLIKPQMTLIAIGYLLVWSFTQRDRLRFAAGFFLTAFALLFSSLWIWPQWLKDWGITLTGYHHYAMPPLVAVLLGTKQITALSGGVIIGLIALSGLRMWQNRSESPASPRFWWTLSFVLAMTSIAILPGQAIYDHVILLPGILMLLQRSRELRQAGRLDRFLIVVGAVVVLWPLMSSLVIVGTHFLTPSQPLGSLLNLPIRTAAPIPFLVVSMLLFSEHIISDRNQELA